MTLVEHVTQLCSRASEGRLVGTAGEARAHGYLTRQLAAAGFEPAAGHAEPFEVTIPELVGRPRFVVDGIELEYLEDFTVNVQGAVEGGDVEGETVWIGAGSVDARAEGRVVVCESPLGLAPAPALQSYLQSHRAARDAGARALVRVADEHRRRKVMRHLREAPGIPSLDVSRLAMSVAFGTLSPEFGKFGARVRLSVPLSERSVSSAGNVVVERGAGPVRLVLVAHYDHVGSIDDDRWFPGAADNASGVAAVLEAARELGAGPLRGRLVVLLPSAEEAGMTGSAHYVDLHYDQLADGPLVLNVDHLGGDPTQPLYLVATKAGAERLPPPSRLRAGWPVVTHPLHPGDFADHASFVPRVSAVAGMFSPSLPDIVHTLRDDPDHLDFRKLDAARGLLVEIGRETFDR